MEFLFSSLSSFFFALLNKNVWLSTTRHKQDVILPLSECSGLGWDVLKPGRLLFGVWKRWCSNIYCNDWMHSWVFHVSDAIRHNVHYPCKFLFRRSSIQDDIVKFHLRHAHTRQSQIKQLFGYYLVTFGDLCSNCWDQFSQTCHVFSLLFALNTPRYFSMSDFSASNICFAFYKQNCIVLTIQIVRFSCAWSTHINFVLFLALGGTAFEQFLALESTRILAIWGAVFVLFLDLVWVDWIWKFLRLRVTGIVRPCVSKGRTFIVSFILDAQIIFLRFLVLEVPTICIVSYAWSVQICTVSCTWSGGLLLVLLAIPECSLWACRLRTVIVWT